MTASQAAPRSALIVNNDAAVRDMLLKLFTEEGYHVVLAGSGAEALKIATSSSIDCALVDQLLPDFSGVELKKRLLKASPEDPRGRPVLLHDHPQLRRRPAVRLLRLHPRPEGGAGAPPGRGLAARGRHPAPLRPTSGSTG